jgi:thiol-disulfide isomerase/thioredoxin
MNTRKAKNRSSGDMDIETEDDIKNLVETMKQFMVVLVFIHADWCGHCQTFKPTWEDYKNTSGRKIPMIKVNEKVLSKTPFANVKVEGFPSNAIYSPKDGSFAKFKGQNGDETHSIPNIRDKVTMTKLLKTDPSKLMPNVEDSQEDPESAEVTPSVRKRMTKTGKNAIKNINSPMNLGNGSPTPPNTEMDKILASPAPRKAVGGSLFETMVRGIKGLGKPTRRRSKGRRGTRKAISW